jgi:protoheme IX farnesyltransferase
MPGVTAVDPRPAGPPATDAQRAARQALQGPGRQVAPVRSAAATTVAAYVALTKPRIIELLLVTTIPTMFLAAHGVPRWSLVALTLVGGALAAASANTLNCYLDRDIDAVMKRTGQRPLATGAVTPRAALVFGIALTAAAVGWMLMLVNPPAAWLSLTAIVFYVFVYTLGLKRRTPQNIVWGGAAGCMPVLIGWSAVTGSLSWAPVVLFAVIFFWTPPHYWPLSLRFVDDYAAAGVPMLPVVASQAVVAGQIIAYSWAMVAVSLLLVPVAHTTAVYAVAAAVLGGGFLLEAYRLRARVRSGSDAKAMRLFHGSITYLTLLFVAVAVDTVLPLPHL